jgi:hypothetical protein
METNPLTMEAMMVAWLQNQRLAKQVPVVVQVRFAISKHETRLLTLQPESPMATINF